MITPHCQSPPKIQPRRRNRYALGGKRRTCPSEGRTRPLEDVDIEESIILRAVSSSSKFTQTRPAMGVKVAL